MEYDVFISYASPDKVVADAVCHTLESHLVKCWMAPRDVTPGTPYARAIIQAIKDSRMMVLIYSKDANKSEHVANEIDRMFSLNKPIIPFLIDETKMNDEYQYYLSRKHWLVAFPEYRDKCEELAETITRLLEIKPQVIHEKEATLPLSDIESYNKGKELYYSGKYAEALDFFTIAAEKGHADAQYFAGLINYLAYCGIMDLKKAAFWFEKAALQDHLYAEEHLGRLYEAGSGVEQSYEKALYWYQESAKHEYADAFYAIGEMYERGKGVEPDEEVAFDYFLQAASAGSSGDAGTGKAMKKLASMYEFGIGTQEDPNMAIKWLKKFLMLNDTLDEWEKKEIIRKIDELES